jgi:integrase
MASFIKRSGNWFATVRRKGYSSISKTFPTKVLAQEWARGIEQSMDASKFSDARMISDIPFKALVTRYIEDIGEEDSFGKNKRATLLSLRKYLGDVPASNLTADRIMGFVRDRMGMGAGGVTIAIDLTYLKQVLDTAKYLWKLPVKPEAIAEARILMQYAGISTRSKERNRRPTEEELEKLYAYFDKPGSRKTLPYSDIIKFAIASAMRLGEITRIQWGDMNEADRTILIRDRKDPKQKVGNDQIVPLLGEAFDIVKRQPRDSDKIFPANEKTISTIFPRACQALGIVDLHFHDFRHEGVSRLFEQSYRIEQVALVSGHRSWENLKRYTQLKAKDLHRD